MDSSIIVEAKLNCSRACFDNNLGESQKFIRKGIILGMDDGWGWGRHFQCEVKKEVES